jgi:hypothetical protein
MKPLITPEEQRTLAESSPKEWADAAKSIATGFLEGFFRGVK